jgi:hypothetical protein
MAPAWSGGPANGEFPATMIHAGASRRKRGARKIRFGVLGAPCGRRARPSTAPILAVEGAAAHGFSSGRRRRGGLMHLGDGSRKASDSPILEGIGRRGDEVSCCWGSRRAAMAKGAELDSGEKEESRALEEGGGGALIRRGLGVGAAPGASGAERRAAGDGSGDAMLARCLLRAGEAEADRWARRYSVNFLFV